MPTKTEGQSQKHRRPQFEQKNQNMQVASATKMTARVASQVGRRHFSKTSATNAKVAVIGAAGGIGQPLSLLMKQSPFVDDLALFDVVNTPGVAADISHCSTNASVSGYTGPDEIGECLTGCTSLSFLLVFHASQV